MAECFYYSRIYESTHWVVLYENAQGYADKFLEYCRDFINGSQFPNIVAEIKDFTTGGGFLAKGETTPMVEMKPKKGNVKKLGAYFRAQQFGNVIFYSCLETVESSFFAAGTSGSALYAMVRSKCKNLASWEEFMAIDGLANLIFYKAIERFDPDYAENRRLLTQK